MTPAEKIAAERRALARRHRIALAAAKVAADPRELDGPGLEARAARLANA